MIFRDRHHAGEELVKSLKKYKDDPNAVVIGLPRGGVVNAYEAAKGLNLPLDIVYPRKIGAPFNPELAIGAITESGEGILNEPLVMQLGVSDNYIKRTIESEKAVAQKRLKMYRKDKPKIPLEGKTVIIVDDGLATGATMKAAIKSVQSEGADRIVIAVPVSPPDTLEEIKELVDEAISLDTPPFFAAVGEFYQDFSQTEDEEVIELLHKNRLAHGKK